MLCRTSLDWNAEPVTTFVLETVNGSETRTVADWLDCSGGAGTCVRTGVGSRAGGVCGGGECETAEKCGALGEGYEWSAAVWSPPQLRFDHIGIGISTLMEISTCERRLEPCNAALDAAP